MRKFILKVLGALSNPVQLFTFIFYRTRGYYYQIRYGLLASNVRLGHNLYARGRLRIRGPGQVILGNNIELDRGHLPVTPYTNKEEAKIIIGDRVKLRSVRFSCCERIEIGDDSMLAECRILDTDFHSINPFKRHDPDAIKISPVTIGKNVWIGTDCFIMRGVQIGDHSTIAAGSVLYSNTIVPAYSVYGGNPATLIKKLDKDRL